MNVFLDGFHFPSNKNLTNANFIIIEWHRKAVCARLHSTRLGLQWFFVLLHTYIYVTMYLFYIKLSKCNSNVNNIISNLLVSPNTNYTMFLLGHNNFELLTGDMHENVYVWWKFSLYFCLPLPLVFSSLLFFHPSSQASPSLLSLFSSFFSFRLCFFRRVRISRLHFSPLLLVSSWCGFSLC